MKKIWIIVLALLSLIFGSSCSVITKEQRREITAECGANTVCVTEKEDEIREDVMYERENQRIKERDDILILMQNCKARGHILWYSGRQGMQRAKGRKNKYFIPHHARLMNYSCLSRDETRRILDRVLGRGF